MKNIKFKVVSVAMLAMMVMLCGCNKIDESSSENKVVYYDDSNVYENPNDKKEETLPQGTEVTANCGEETEIADCTVKFKEMLYIGTTDYAGYPRALYAGVFEVANNGSEAVDTSSIANFVMTVDGTDITDGMSGVAAVRATKMLSDLTMLPEEVAAGESVVGFVTFETMPDWESAVISYMPGYGDGNYDRVSYTINAEDVIDKT